ncbi:hypothetical protein I551_8236 [Mycobacterium ulcerans str. Harvey]|uniref:Secreted protein n=1 Tax=Mycobacterium ulcerans str. Harvey TaxID=1299332 RepID=A0ABN0QL46_MYCUL|nr:hypothetical protein I551_8236 [Mycobacterium ulcerans str. Harvey]
MLASLVMAMFAMLAAPRCCTAGSSPRSIASPLRSSAPTRWCSRCGGHGGQLFTFIAAPAVLARSCT